MSTTHDMSYVTTVRSQCGTYHGGADTGDQPAYSMCIPVHAIRAPETALVYYLQVVRGTEGAVLFDHPGALGCGRSGTSRSSQARGNGEEDER